MFSHDDEQIIKLNNMYLIFLYELILDERKIYFPKGRVDCYGGQQERIYFHGFFHYSGVKKFWRLATISWDFNTTPASL